MRVLDHSTLVGRSKAVEHRWRYGLLVEDIEVDAFQCESYGMVIQDEVSGEKSQVRHITVNAQEAVSLLGLLAQNAVTPCTLADVVEDWMGR